MPVWNTEPNTDEGGSTGSGIDRVLQRAIKNVENDPQLKLQFAQLLQQNGIPPQLLLDLDDVAEAQTDGGADPGPGPADHTADVGEPVDVEGSTADPVTITPQDVRSFLDEAIAFAGEDATLGDLRDLDDQMIQTALRMSSLPS